MQADRPAAGRCQEHGLSGTERAETGGEETVSLPQDRLLGDCHGPVARTPEYPRPGKGFSVATFSRALAGPFLRSLPLWAALLAGLAQGSVPTGAGWKESRFRPFTFHYLAHDEKLVGYLGRLSQEIERRVTEDLGLPGLDEIQVTIASTHEDFLSLQPPGPKAQKWAAALAYPSQDRILMKSPRLLTGGQPHYEEIFLHEAAHIALDQACRPGRRDRPGARCAAGAACPESEMPRWLHEGYAIYLTREWSPSREVLLTRAVLRGGLIPLGRLVSGFPEEESQAALAYAQSADLVHYLIRRFGSKAFHGFVVALGKGERFGHAVRTLLGEDFRSLEEDWQRHLRIRYTWLPLLTSTGSLWFLASLLFLAAYARKRFRARAKAKEWAQEELGPVNGQATDADRNSRIPARRTPGCNKSRP